MALYDATPSSLQTLNVYPLPFVRRPYLKDRIVGVLARIFRLANKNAFLYVRGRICVLHVVNGEAKIPHLLPELERATEGKGHEMEIR
jgi:hypothetical protein